jgi:hypothetical protein
MKKSMDTWQNLMEMARQRKVFTNKEIDAFGIQCDFLIWVDLTGLEGMIYYIHIIGSRHMTFYLQEWKNIYRHSQQGFKP